MKTKIYVGFKGKNNTSCRLVECLSNKNYLLTNSFGGARKDIDKLNIDEYDAIFMFGVDKSLKNTIRIEKIAERENCKLFSNLDLEEISKKLNAVGVRNYISETIKNCLCNEAYWYALEKFACKVVFIHIPSIKNMDEDLLKKIKIALT